MIESLLCTLDIFTGLHFGIYSTKHHSLTPDLEPLENTSALQVTKPRKVIVQQVSKTWILLIFRKLLIP